MELSVDQKIKAAIDPLIQRIAALQADNLLFQQDLAVLQALSHPKPTHKPPPKTSFEHGQRPQTAKINKKEPEHHEVKPDTKAMPKGGQKKEESKHQQEEAKIEVTKPIVAKPGTTGAKPIAPAANKDGNEVKGGKTKPTAIGTKPATATTHPKGLANEKKPTHKNNQPDHEKKEEGQQDKKHVSHQKQHKTNSTHAIKSPVTNKPKPVQKPAQKKPVVPPSPILNNKKQPPVIQKAEPKTLKGGKPKPAPEPQVKEQVKEQEKKQAKQAQVHGEQKAQTNIPQNEAQNPTLTIQVLNETAQVAEAKEQQKKQVTEQVNGELRQLQQAGEQVEEKLKVKEQTF